MSVVRSKKNAGCANKFKSCGRAHRRNSKTYPLAFRDSIDLTVTKFWSVSDKNVGRFKRQPKSTVHY